MTCHFLYTGFFCGEHKAISKFSGCRVSSAAAAATAAGGKCCDPGPS